jgi:isoleucyl-tRNA synthetase
VLYASIEGWTPGRSGDLQLTELDRWLQSRLATLVQTVRERLDDYDAMDAARAIEEFLDGLSNWYIRRSRQRFYGSEGQAAFATLHETLVVLTRLLAPFMPFLSEELFQNLVRSVDASAPESVHHCPYPEVDAASRDVELEQNMEWARVVASLGNAARKGAAIPSRQPLPALRVAGGSTFKDLPAWATGLVQEELNVRRVEFAEELTEAVRQKAEGNPKLLGPKFGKDYPRIRAALQAGSFSVDVDGRVRIEEFELQPDEVILSLEPAPGYAAAADHGVLVVLDTTLTPELLAEGRAREVVRLIQDARKRAGFLISDRIHVRYNASDGVAEAFEQHAEYIRRETLATALEPGLDGAQDWHRAEAAIDGVPVVVAVQRAAGT